MLSAASVAITVATIVAVLVYHAGNGQQAPGVSAGLSAPQADPVGQALLGVITVALVALAAVNAIFDQLGDGARRQASLGVVARPRRDPDSR